jgi:tripartite-type tricarboxylate transporter receptor subunit TctC
MTRLIDNKLIHAMIVALALGAAALPAQAQDAYPAKPVQMITPAAAGNGPDVVARIVADHLSRLWKEQVLVVNRPGASGLLAAVAAQAAAADGYTLYASNTSSMVVLPVTGKVPFDMATAFAPIGMYGEQTMAIAVAPSLGVNSLAELIALAKKKPGEIFFAATTRESLPHYTMQMVLMAAQASMTYVFYSSTSQALTDIAGGRLSVVVDGYAAMTGAIAAGVLKPLAITAEKRLADHPNLPTVAETIPNLSVSAWFPLLAPAQTPRPIVDKISRDLRTVAAEPELQERLGKIGAYTRSMTSQETTAYIAAERVKWLPAIEKVASMPK